MNLAPQRGAQGPIHHPSWLPVLPEGQQAGEHCQSPPGARVQPVGRRLPQDLGS